MSGSPKVTTKSNPMIVTSDNLDRTFINNNTEVTNTHTQDYCSTYMQSIICDNLNYLANYLQQALNYPVEHQRLTQNPLMISPATNPPISDTIAYTRAFVTDNNNAGIAASTYGYDDANKHVNDSRILHHWMEQLKQQQQEKEL